MEIVLDAKKFYSRLTDLYTKWKENDGESLSLDSMVIICGRAQEQIPLNTSSILHYWLLDYEFTDTVLLFTPKEVLCLTSSKKKNLLEDMEQPAHYGGPELKVLLKNPKSDCKGEFEKLISCLKSSSKKTKQIKVGVLHKDKLSGEFGNSFMESIKGIPESLTLVEASPLLEMIFSNKDEIELDSIRNASKYNNFIMKKLIEEVETIVDEEDKVKHSQLSDKIDELMDSEESQKFCKSNKIDDSIIESVHSPIIQSGGVYNLRVICQNDDSEIKGDVILLSTGIKYKSYCSSCARTLIIDPADQQKKAYNALYEAYLAALQQITVGNEVSKVYSAAIDTLKSKDETYIKHLPAQLGFGIGIAFRESRLLITESNHTKLAAGNSIVLRVALSKLVCPKGDYSLLIQDTIILQKDKREVLTNSVPKAYKDISYTMEDEPPPPPRAEIPIEETKDRQMRQSTRQLRATNNQDIFKKETERREHQEILIEKNLEVLKHRFENDEIGEQKKKGAMKNMSSLSSYKSTNQFPVGAHRNHIYIDPKHESILFPIHGRLIPFHISTVKNVSKSEEGSYIYLRINFHVPGSIGTNQGNINFPELVGEEAIYIKELSFRSSDTKSFNDIFKMIKELIKKVKAKELETLEKRDLKEQAHIQILKGKRPMLNEVTIRPTLAGKKSQGTLEGHANGLRFTTGKGDRLDLIYSNIKHAFFQPCDKDLIVLLHFHLFDPIMTGKKKSLDVQFYTETGLVADDLSMRFRHVQTDLEELEMEEKERIHKHKINDKFRHFVQDIEQLSKLNFDAPYRELGFYGVPVKSNVLLLPTVHCLVNLTEQPFFVADLDDIEFVYFERVNFSIRNFDMVLIYKDLTNFTRIGSIPSDSLEPIKQWLDSVELCFAEGTISINWNNVLSSVRADPESFINDGGWAFLTRDHSGSEGEHAVSEDSEFSDGGEEEESDSESSNDSYDEGGSSSSMGSEEQLDDDEEALSWDEMEQKAHEQDQKEQWGKRKGQQVTGRGDKRQKYH